MPFKFAHFCSLLIRLEDIELHDPPFLPAEKPGRLRQATEQWFMSHRRNINELDAVGATALLSSLLPERRTDRVYGIQSTSLCRILCRTLNLSASRAKDLRAYKTPGNGDLASCLERVLKVGGPPAIPAVTIEEIDKVFVVLAGQSRFSDPKLRIPPSTSEARDDLLGHILKRLHPAEGKWFARVILKDLSPIRLGEPLVLKSFHFLLSDLLHFQQSFEAAFHLLKGPLQQYPSHPDARSETLHRKSAAESLRPEIGTKVGRPTFQKARSIDHCLKMMGPHPWILERKYDGEYCEVHIDMSRGLDNCIKIFSKSSKDSTEDRRKLHSTLRDCLRLGRSDCRIEKQAILIGEMVVFSDKENDILPFDKIRKHVARSGVFLGTEKDSQAHLHEHLMIVFFDLLLLDDEVIMTKPTEERRTWLRELYDKKHGRAIGAEWKIVDFSQQAAKPVLVQQFAASIAKRCEGLVLKPCGVPYFSLNGASEDPRRYFIKLKKDYITSMGDEADFAVIGASYDAQEALKCSIKSFKWTNFHLGCLTNKADVERFGTRPVFKVVGTIAHDQCIPAPILSAVNAVGHVFAKTYFAGTQPANFDISHAPTLRIDVTFEKPFVFEVLGSSFAKPASTGFYMLRHPRVKKLHEDRSWKDCVSFQELQQQAEEALSKPMDSESQEGLRCVEKLEKRCKRKFERQQTTPRSSTKTSPRNTGVATSANARKCASPGVHIYEDATTVSPSIDGTTLVADVTVSAKRARDEDAPASEGTPCRSAKRHCTARPLADVTDKPLQRSPSELPPTGQQQPSVLKQPQPTVHGLHENLQGSLRTFRQKTTKRPASPVGHDQSSLFGQAVVYLAPCIAGALYVTEDLLPLHGATVAKALSHWDRHAYEHAPLTTVQSESQAYAGMRKVVLVESKRQAPVRALVAEVMKLNRGKCRERIEFFDWRILEELCTGEQHGKVGHATRTRGQLLQKHLLGAIVFDEGRDQAIFASGRSWLNQ